MRRSEAERASAGVRTAGERCYTVKRASQTGKNQLKKQTVLFQARRSPDRHRARTARVEQIWAIAPPRLP